MSDEHERREFLRVPFRVEVTLTGDHATVISADVYDVSLNGLYAAGAGRLPPGSRCEVLLVLGGPGSEVRLSLRGRVARVDRAGMGVEFLDMELDTYFHLRNLVRFNSDDQARVEQEFQAHLGRLRRDR
jgi:ethanolamine utilization microcompartment shell protein EutL